MISSQWQYSPTIADKTGEEVSGAIPGNCQRQVCFVYLRLSDSMALSHRLANRLPILTDRESGACEIGKAF